MSSFGPPAGGWPSTRDLVTKVPRERQLRIAPGMRKRQVTWVLTDYFCPHCGKQAMWNLDEQQDDKEA